MPVHSNPSTSGHDGPVFETTEIISSEPTRTAKAPTDALRLAVAVISLLAVVIIGALFDEAIVDFVADLTLGIEALPTWLITGLVLFGQILGVIVMAGRVYVGAHNPLDVTAGLGVGLLVGSVLDLLLR